MSIPSYDQLIGPLLTLLAEYYPQSITAKTACEQLAQRLGLTNEQKNLLLESGQPVYKNRIQWANDRLKRAGFSDSSKRGVWCLTAAGLDYLKLHPNGLSDHEVRILSHANNHISLKKASTEVVYDPQIFLLEDFIEQLSPDEKIEQALEEIRSSVSQALLEQLMQVTPSHFETIVLDILHRLGYGADRESLKQVGSSGDEGIDGMIYLDKLGLEKVYVQAKRWANSVGRPEIQAFYGALAGQKARRGVFITTSNYSKQATDYAQSVEGLVLIDGKKLVVLMIENGIGTSLKAIYIPKIDTDYFIEN